MAGSQVLAEALGLGVGAGRGGHAQAEQADHDEVERVQVGQLVAADLEIGGLGEQLAEPRDVEILAQPAVGLGVAGPQTDVGVAALVAGPRAADQAERGPPSRS